MAGHSGPYSYPVRIPMDCIIGELIGNHRAELQNGKLRMYERERAQEKIMLEDIRIERTEKDRVVISWKNPKNDISVRIYMNTSPFFSDDQPPAVESIKGGRAEISGLDPGHRYYFRLISDGLFEIIISERLVQMEGTVNFRDLGGYETEDGRRIKWGQIFRSDSLARLTDFDRTLIKRMGIRTVYDFRTRSEVKKSPDRLPHDGSIKYVNVPIKHGEFDFVKAIERIKEGDDTWMTDDFMVKGYITNIAEFHGTWGSLFNQLNDRTNRPTVFHCTGGKDRAGTFAALILLALGVPKETVIYDHQLSNRYISKILDAIYSRIESYGVDPLKLAPYFQAPLDCIEALLDHISSNYGGVNNYLTSKAGLTREGLDKLRDELLE